ncbi:MAG: GPR endopeptidase [Clostridia bacterium]|nr:GPR endopeptidase [Clostridia bacterium]
MNIRTDLALERRELVNDECQGVECDEYTKGNAKITRIKVLNKQGEEAVGKPIGTYITIEGDLISNELPSDDNRRNAVSEELKRLLPKDGTILVAGLGNSDITPDALGPKTASGILATRHIDKDLAETLGLGNLRSVSAISPGVLGKTGIETVEIINGIISRVKPSAVIIIDALASRRLSRLGTTIQISDSGICPGSGVGNSRSEISEKTVGVPVIAIGVPTVVDASTLAEDIMQIKGENTPPADSIGMMVTPREIDTVIDRASGVLSMAINCALHPQMSAEDLSALI